MFKIGKVFYFFIIYKLHYEFQYFWAFSLSIFVVESLVFRGGGGDSEADREPDINQQQLYSIRKHLYFDYLNVYFVETVDFSFIHIVCKLACLRC